MRTLKLLESGLESRLIPEAAYAAAYAKTGGRGRALLKKCIARLYRVFGESALAEEHISRFREGFTLRTGEFPAAFALFACEAAHAGAPLCLAALLPALLAGAPVLFCFVPGRKPFPSPRLLTALELAGVEKSYLAPEAEILRVLRKTGSGCRGGRAVLLGHPEDSAGIAAFAHANAMPCLSLTHAPPLLVIRGGLMPSPGKEPGAPSLTVDADHADFRLWPGLDPGWFRERSFALASAGNGAACHERQP
ncbi:MAG: hypothetical protein LBB52_05735 [Desulfovibrio sp.]|jgi:hypothetical protein|nr:hypothetical protein [Desulfovibrio sp.]